MNLDKTTRVEVIDENGRSYVKYLTEDQEVVYSLQDDDRTLKVFIQKKRTECEHEFDHNGECLKCDESILTLEDEQ